MQFLGNNVVFIPVRGGSKGIPGKNIKEMAGFPLIYYALTAAYCSDEVDCVVVASDSTEIFETCQDYYPESDNKVLYYKRSDASATDTASTEQVMLEFAQKYDFGNIILIQATSPLIKSEDVQLAISKFGASEYGGLLSVVEQSRFYWKQNTDGSAIPINYNPSHRPRRQDFEASFVENGCLYITRREFLLKSRCRISSPFVIYPMRVETYWEIDDLHDWKIIERLMLAERKQERLRPLKGVRFLVMDFDGVFTDNKVIVFQDGQEAVVCDRGDGMGLSELKKLGIPLLVLSKERNNVLRARCVKLGIECINELDNKLDVLKERASQLGLDLSQVAYIGNDINDIPCMQAVGFSIAVADSHPSVLQLASIITKNRGGDGAIREICDLIQTAVHEN